MSNKVRLVLTIAKIIRCAEVKSGSVLLEGECLRDFTTADINKAIQLQQIKAAEIKPAPAKSEKGK